MMSKSLSPLLALWLLLLPFATVHAAAEAAQQEGPKKALYLPIAEKFVINVQDGQRMRFMQVKVQAMTRDERVAAAIEANMPALSHAMIMLLSSQDAATMRNTQGREQVRMQALSELQQVLGEVAGISEGLEAVYFTDFVIQ